MLSSSLLLNMAIAKEPMNPSVNGTHWEVEETIPKNWMGSYSSAAHFKKIGSVAQSVGYAHITFFLDLNEIEKDMAQCCNQLTGLIERSSYEMGQEWIMMARRCHDEIQDLKDLRKMWVTHVTPEAAREGQVDWPMVVETPYTVWRNQIGSARTKTLSKEEEKCCTW